MGVLGLVFGFVAVAWCYGFVFMVIAVPLLEAAGALVEEPRLQRAAVWVAIVFAGGASWWLNAAFEVGRIARASAG
jgi:hypothetical protein